MKANAPGSVRTGIQRGAQQKVESQPISRVLS
jgi:hypothetical protein